MINITVTGDGHVQAEDNDGQMVIIRPDGSVSSYLEGDKGWVHGQTGFVGAHYWEGPAWELIGYHLGMGPGEKIKRSRNGTTH